MDREVNRRTPSHCREPSCRSTPTNTHKYSRVTNGDRLVEGQKARRAMELRACIFACFASDQGDRLQVPRLGRARLGGSLTTEGRSGCEAPVGTFGSRCERSEHLACLKPSGKAGPGPQRSEGAWVLAPVGAEHHRFARTQTEGCSLRPTQSKRTAFGCEAPPERPGEGCQASEPEGLTYEQGARLLSRPRTTRATFGRRSCFVASCSRATKCNQPLRPRILHYCGRLRCAQAPKAILGDAYEYFPHLLTIWRPPDSNR